MIEINFKRDNETIPVKVKPGFTLMEAAKQADLPEIPADCGGCQACATCHVKIDKDWTIIVGQPDLNSVETELIEYEEGYDRMHSRLACQIVLEEKHNGLVVHLLKNHLL